MYSESFKCFVRKGVDKYFVGTGNPNAPILFIGKESTISSKNHTEIKWYSQNAHDWQKHILENTCETLEYDVNETHVLRKGWGKNTWSKYQRLSDSILEKESQKFKVDFLKFAFTTEINDSPELNTSNADKCSLNTRKKLFNESDFIQNFPVIVLACSNYIRKQ